MAKTCPCSRVLHAGPRARGSIPQRTMAGSRRGQGAGCALILAGWVMGLVCVGKVEMRREAMPRRT